MSCPDRRQPLSALLLTLFLGSFAAGTANAAPFAFVPNEKAGTVSVIDIATDTVSPAGKRPRGISP